MELESGASIAEALAAMARDVASGDARELGRAAGRMARERFSWESVARETATTLYGMVA